MNINFILPSNKKFGISFFIIFLFISILLFFYSFYKMTLLFLLISFLFLLLALLKPSLLYYLNYSWMLFGYLLSKITSPIIIGLIFYFLITPVGIFRRLIGSDELKIKNKQNETMWIENKRDTFNFNDQF